MLSVAMILLSVLWLPVWVARLPVNYFTVPHVRSSNVLYWALRHIVGVLLLLAGIAMLVLPGQGVLAIFIAICMMDIPGKQRWIQVILRNEQVRRGLNWLRRRHGKAELEWPDT